jgi:hypothetical protein
MRTLSSGMPRRYEALSYYYLRPSAALVCDLKLPGIKLLVYEALSYWALSY